MLIISLDEAYVFDLLSIYQVKINKSEGDKKFKSIKSYDNLKKEIINQIGSSKFVSIIDSTEYKNLIFINQKVFELVDRANESELSKITADANYERYLEKIKLQNKFFDNELDEIKV